MSGHHFHFTLGPVQSFVAQARRTRDFWAGSFLLSWLSSVAIKAVQSQGAEVEFPQPKTDYMNWLTGSGKGRAPEQGSIPNRFKALSAKVGTDFDPKLVVSSVQQAWHSLSEIIWENDLAPLALSLGDERLSTTRIIWNRQNQSFWEISWVLSDDHAAVNLLDQRKNWRNHLHPEEAGVKCMLMDGWQELSGLSTPNREGLALFWDEVRRGKNGMQFDIREGEALCALAFIKRRFVRYFSQLTQTMPGDWTLKGWPLPTAIPSLAHIAAGRWLAQGISKLHKTGQLDLLENYVRLVNKTCSDVANERDALLPAVLASAKKAAIPTQWAEQDASFWYDFLLTQEIQDVRLRQKSDFHQTIQALNRLQQEIGTPSPFYAVLLMDGDNLGSQMGDPHKQNGISNALSRFTDQIPEIIKQHNGFLIYAGGDDILALLGVSDALACAIAVRHCYQDCFAKENNKLKTAKIQTSLSGAINIGHIKWPLRELLFDSHQLLDEVAKESTGRDALAIRVWKRDKPYLCWSAPWEHILNSDGNHIDCLLHSFAGGAISNSFVFKLRKLIADLDLNKDHPFGLQDVSSLLHAEYLHSVSQGTQIPSREWFDALVSLCQIQTRTQNDNKTSDMHHPKLTIDGALLLHFFEEHYRSAGVFDETDEGAN